MKARLFINGNIEFVNLPVWFTFKCGDMIILPRNRYGTIKSYKQTESGLSICIENITTTE